MLKLSAFAIPVYLISFLPLQAQLKRFYTLEDASSFDTVTFNLHATSGISFVRNVASGNPLTIFGNPNLDRINPTYSAETNKNNCIVDLHLKEYKESTLGNGLAFAMLSTKMENEENYWKFLINDHQVYCLNFNYGIGSSDIDLSNASIKNMSVKTGSADVTVNYLKKSSNQIDMDTFLVKVDLGSLFARDLSLARAGEVIAEIGFGQAVLDFSIKPETKSNIHASVGAGKLEVILPNNSPVIIHLKDSPFCGITIPKGFEEVEKNIFVNMTYDPTAENLLSFNINVTMGTVNFIYAD